MGYLAGIVWCIAFGGLGLFLAVGHLCLFWGGGADDGHPSVERDFLTRIDPQPDYHA